MRMASDGRQHLDTTDSTISLTSDSLLPAGQEWFTVKQIAALFLIAENSVHNSFDADDESRRLLGLGFKFTGDTDRSRKRIPRAMLAMWMLKHANFSGPIFTANGRDFARTLRTPQLRELVQLLTEELARRGA